MLAGDLLHAFDVAGRLKLTCRSFCGVKFFSMIVPVSLLPVTGLPM